jgi:hypothetical protein
VKLIIPISVGLLSLSYASIKPTKEKNTSLVHSSSTPGKISVADADAKLVYESAELQKYGLSQKAFDYAWSGYKNLLAKNKISRSNYLTICDFSQSSLKKRLYIIDLEKSGLIINTYVAHGKNSGGEFATQFSNKPESLQSSLGFYITSNTYDGKHGLSLRLNGVDPGFNDKALERTIVIHGANYVSAERAKTGTYMGRSWGCPAVPENESAKIINTIKNGSCLFIYHPSDSYLQHSKILND